MRSGIIVLLVSCLSMAAQGGEEKDWQRVVCIDDPKLTVTLLLKATATPADEEFVGFELNNKTDEPMQITNANYRLDHCIVSTMEGKPLRQTNMANGNPYSLLWRDGQQRPRGSRDVIQPGVHRHLKHNSAYSFALLGWPMDKGNLVQGTVYIQISLPGQHLETPRAGLPFAFRWMPPDKKGFNALRERLKSVLAQPQDPFGDSYMLKMLLNHKDVSSAVTIDELLEGFKRQHQMTRKIIREHIDQLYAKDEKVIAFYLDVIQSRDRLLLMELSNASHIRDKRLIEPLMQWIREDRSPFHASQFAMVVLKRERDLMADRKAITSELGQIWLSRLPSLPNGNAILTGEYPMKDPAHYWGTHLGTLALTGDESLVKYILPYLDNKDIALDANSLQLANDGMSIRVCDCAYNAILDLLDRPGERFTIQNGWLPPAKRPSLQAEFEHRDELIAKLRESLKN